MNKSATVANSILWAAAIIASAIVLKGTPQAWPMLGILSGAATASTLLLGSSCRRQGARSQN